MIYPIAAAAVAALLGFALGLLHQRARQAEPVLVRKVEDALPGTQCGLCGYPGCRPYAEAIVQEEAPITLCPPGGDRLVHTLSELLNVDPTGLRADAGAEAFSQVAMIRESDCIGCALCLSACPFDAIAGTQGSMHTVLADLCTGCGLCVAPCPVDCIAMVDVTRTEKVVPVECYPPGTKSTGASGSGFQSLPENPTTAPAVQARFRG